MWLDETQQKDGMEVRVGEVKYLTVFKSDQVNTNS